MGSIYAIANQKGGVGKTTTAVNVAACIAEAGYKTLLVDIDPQANATVALGLGRDLSPNTYDFLLGRADVSKAIRKSNVKGLDVIPSSRDLAGATVELPREERYEFMLAEALNAVKSQYAFIILDCPPSLGPLTVNSLAAADKLIVPIQAEFFALDGMTQMLDTVSMVKRQLNPRLQIAGMLLTMYDGRTKLSQDVEREVRKHFSDLVFRTVIPRNVRLGEAPSYGRPIIHHDPHCSGSDAYFDLAKEVAERG